MKLWQHSIFILLFALALGGCNSGRQEPPKVPVVALNAAPSYPDLSFLRVEHVEGTIPYRGGQGFSFDADTYTFHVDTSTPDGISTTRLAEREQKIEAGHEYTFLLREIGGALDVQVLDEPAPTDTSMRIVHASTTIGNVDAYFAASGTDITTITPVVSNVAFGDITAPTTVADGDYVLTLTAPGDPTSVLLATPVLTLTGPTNAVFTIVDGANSGIDPQSVMVATNSGVANFADPSLNGVVRVISAVADRNPIDLPIDGQTPALFQNEPFGTVSDYLPVAAGDHTFTVNAAGDPNTVIVASTTLSVAPGGRYTILVGGNVDAAAAFPSLDDLRPIPDRARVHYLNGSAAFPSLDFFMVPSGSTIDATTGTNVLPTDIPLNKPFPPGDYELYIRQNGTTTVLSGPTPLTLAAGGVYGIVAVDSAAGGSIDPVLFDDFN